MSEVSNSLVRYSQCCTRGEIIALLYNRAVQGKNMAEITPEVAEELVHKKLGDARTLEGRIVPSQEGYLDEINGIPLNVWCYAGAIDVFGYLHGDGTTLIRSFISQKLIDKPQWKAQSVKWQTI